MLEAKAVKKIPPPFFTALLVAALFFLGTSFVSTFGISQKGMVRVAEASFLDTIVAFVTINPLRVHISTPSEAELGRNFKAEVIVENRGKARISNVEVEIFISNGLVLVSKNVSKEIGNVSGNRQKKIFWQVKGIETGNFGISVRATGAVRGDAVSAEGNTAFVTVKEKSSPPGKSTNIFQSFFSFFKKWF